MAKIAEFVNRIRSAIYGKDVRESIAAGIEAINAEAENAKTSAAQSAQEAAAAKQIADDSAANANQKAQLAEEKAGLADQAARNAAEKANAADTAAANANKATTEAITARDAANTAAQEANTSKEAADDAAGSANAAAQAADIAALNAGNAASDANAAKENAQTQANYAQEQGNRAKAITDELEGTDIGGLAAGIVELRNGKQNKATAAKHTFRTVIGTSAAGWTADECDYLCDGADDQVEINAAIQALPAEGGEIHFLDGTYNITGQIKVDRPHTALSGNSGLAVLKRMYSSILGDGETVSSVSTGLLDITAEFCSVQDFTIDGNKSYYGSTGNNGITMENVNDVLISRNNFKGNSQFGICITGNCWEIELLDNWFSENQSNVKVYDTSRCFIKRNRFLHSSVTSVQLEKVDECKINHNSFSGGSTSLSLKMANYNTIQGNLVRDFTSAGIRIFGSSGNIVTGNACMCGTGQPSDYRSSQYTIQLKSAADENGVTVASERNLVADNLILGKDYVCDGGMDNTFVNNKFE